MKKIIDKLFECSLCNYYWVEGGCSLEDCPQSIKPKPRLKRLPVPIDEKVIIELQGLIQARTQKRMSMAAIVRFALEELLKTEAELAE